MIICDKLYVGDSLQKNKARIIQRIIDEKPKARLYIVSLASHPANLLEIQSYNQLLLPHCRREKIEVVGIASTREEAFDMVTAIISNVYHRTNGFDVRKYFGK